MCNTFEISELMETREHGTDVSVDQCQTIHETFAVNTIAKWVIKTLSACMIVF